jgi:CPA2 family monovalent cation:H+ antiporter-2
MAIELLSTLVIIFGLSALIVFILLKFRIPPIVGFLTAGALLGPHGFALVHEIRDVEILAEIGVILLLFTVGLEISTEKLRRIHSTILRGGLAQVLLTLVAAAVIAYQLLGELNPSLFIGSLVALSSTAIVMRMLLDRAEVDSPQGRLSTGILIFQDLCVVPLMLIIPLLAGKQGSFPHLLWTLFKSASILFMVIFGAKWLVPRILHQIVHTRSRELFIITILIICLGTALLTSHLGLSLAIGAFLAGLIISESEYAYQAISDILPFKESFNGLFFISVGMLLDVGFFEQYLLPILLVLVVILLLKTFTGLVSVLLLGHPFRISLLTGLYLAQIGEFSFVLATAGRTAGLLSSHHFQLFLSASILTMVLTPFLIQASHGISNWVSSRKLLERLDRMRRRAEREGIPSRREDHTIVIGFGLIGRTLAGVLKEASIPYAVVELNNQTVIEMKKRGEPIFYGDGTSSEILRKLGIETARLLVISIPDPASTRTIVRTARQANPKLHILVRTRYVQEVDDLVKLGANEVVPEEFATSVEIFARALDHYRLPGNLVEGYMDRFRSDSYQILRKVDLPDKELLEKCVVVFSDTDTASYLVTEGSPSVGHSIEDLRIRCRTGATVIAVKRSDKIIPSPEPGFIFLPNDVVYLIGKKENVRQAIELLES